VSVRNATSIHFFVSLSTYLWVPLR
jgi:hypothetical protein